MPYKDPVIRRTKQQGYSERYYARFPLRVKAKKAVWHANKKAISLGLNGRLHRTEVELLLESNKKCAICGDSDNLSIDHIIPFKLGGDNVISNIQIICWLCNMKKTYKEKITSWSTHGDKCKGCNSSERRHEAKGYCFRCYNRVRKGWTTSDLSKPKMVNRWW